MSLNAFLKSIEGGEILLPELRRYMLRRVKLEEAGKLSRKDVTIVDAEMVIKWAKDRIAEFNHGEEIPGEYFHPSALGTCQRKVYFGIKNAPQDTTGNVTQKGTDLLKSHLTFETGTHIHLIVQNLCELAGILIKREVAIQDKVRKILGHCDGTLRIDKIKYVLEIKSINSAGFSKTTAPKHEHKAQTTAYMRCLGYRWGIILYVNKDTGQMKEFVIPYDHQFYMEHVKQRIRRFFSKLKRNKVPPREGTHPRQYPCMFCPYTRVCFETGRLEQWKETLTPEQIKKNH